MRVAPHKEFAPAVPRSGSPSHSSPHGESWSPASNGALVELPAATTSFPSTPIHSVLNQSRTPAGGTNRQRTGLQCWRGKAWASGTSARPLLPPSPCPDHPSTSFLQTHPMQTHPPMQTNRAFTPMHHHLGKADVPSSGQIKSKTPRLHSLNLPIHSHPSGPHQPTSKPPSRLLLRHHARRGHRVGQLGAQLRCVHQVLPVLAHKHNQARGHHEGGDDAAANDLRVEGGGCSVLRALAVWCASVRACSRISLL